jgi:hypothetical protein
MWRAVLWVKPMNSRPGILLAISGRLRGEGGGFWGGRLVGVDIRVHDHG